MRDMNILVTGGAGYIGSAVVKSLISKGYEVIVVDNLSKGSKEFIDQKAVFYEIDLTNKEALNKIFSENKIEAVVHIAGYKSVEESMENPEKYAINITGTVNILDCMVKHNVKKIIFSSSAVVYGMPDNEIIDENTPLNPISIYGLTKVECEKTLESYHKTHNINYISLRYFNVAGDSGLNYTDPDSKNIFPIIMEVISGKRGKLTIFGDDYKTKDGTCVRDYIDVNDLVDAHVLALETDYTGIINLGSGKGFSVKEIVDTFTLLSNTKFKYEFGPRREGDPDTVVASNKKANEILKWSPKRNIKDMVKSTIKAYSYYTNQQQK